MSKQVSPLEEEEDWNEEELEEEETPAAKEKDSGTENPKAGWTLVTGRSHKLTTSSTASHFFKARKKEMDREVKEAVQRAWDRSFHQEGEGEKEGNERKKEGK